MQVGEEFKITIYTEDLKEQFEIDQIDANCLSNTKIIKTHDKQVFSFLPLCTGKSKFSLRKVVFTNIIDNYITYHLTISQKKSNKIRVKTTKIDQKQPKLNQEKKLFNVILELKESNLLEKAIKKIKEFNKLFPQSKYNYPIVIIHGEILEKNNQFEQSFNLLQQFRQNHNVSAKHKVDLLIKLALLKNQLQEPTESIALLLMAKEEPKLSKINREWIHFYLAESYFKQKKYKAALKYYELIYVNHKQKHDIYNFNIYDKTLMQMAILLEINPKTRDIQKADSIYTELIEDYPNSFWVPAAREKKQYLKQNFINPK